MKKRLTKNEREIVQKIKKIQERSVKRMREKSVQLSVISQNIVKKIDENGIDGYYSCNNDCFRVSQDIWKESLRLAELKSMEDNILDSFSSKRFISKKRK